MDGWMFRYADDEAISLHVLPSTSDLPVIFPSGNSFLALSLSWHVTWTYIQFLQNVLSVLGSNQMELDQQL